MSQNDNTPTPVPDVPVAVPLGSLSTGANLQVGRPRGEFRETNTAAGTPPQRPAGSSNGRVGRRIGGVRLQAIAESLSDRDRAMLGLLAVHGYLSTKHVEVLGLQGHSASTSERLARRLMTRLNRLGLVQSLERRVGGVRAGSSASIWQLSAAGRRLVATGQIAKRPHEPSPRLLAHSLAVADTHLAIAALPATTAHVQSIDVQIESGAWRRYQGLGGDRRLLQPDLAATLHGTDDQGSFEDRWFVEVDCGTESIPTLLKKCHQYDDYRRSGTEQAAHDVFPRVMWVMGGPRRHERADDLRRRLDRASYPVGMFTVTTAKEVQATIGGAS